MTATATAPQKDVARKPAKHRSPNYPAVGLGEGIRLVRALYDKAKRTSVPETVAATAMGYKGLTGTTRGHLSALRKYGLIEDEPTGGVRVSELGMRILMNPEGSQDRQAAVAEAAGKPEIFREIAQSHGEAADDVLRPYLVLKRGFSEVGAEQFIRSFRDTLALAGRLESGYDPGMANDSTTPTPTPVANPFSFTGAAKPQVRFFSWPLDNNTTAEVRIISTDPVSRDHLDALTDYLEVAKKRLTPREDA
jgi:hypothetical protein